MQSSCLSKRHLFRASHFRAIYGINLGRSQGARCVCCLLCQFALADSTDWPCVCLILWPMSFWPLASIPYPSPYCLLPAVYCVLPVAFPAAFVSTIAAASQWKIFAYAHAQWVSWPHNALALSPSLFYLTFLRITCPLNATCSAKPEPEPNPNWPALAYFHLAASS